VSDMDRLTQIGKETRAWACYDCGKCTANCPIARAGAPFSPRRQVLSTNLDHREAIESNGSLGICLTCMKCDSSCPASVEYSKLVQKLREYTYREDNVGYPHGGALQSTMRMMAAGKTVQNRMDWITDDIRITSDESEVFYWTGCTMYLDAFFDELGVHSLNGTRAAISILNQHGITPIVSPSERCCGHDLLWGGDRKSFDLLAKHNVELVESSKASILVVSCAECLRTWKIDYAPYFSQRPPEILHISEFINARNNDLSFKENGDARIVTYQDPCRLGRHLEIYDAPRSVLGLLPGIELAEMHQSGKRAVCCAGSTWTNCDRYSKAIQVGRLKEAKATGASTLVTCCPKCQVHLKCAMNDPNLKEDIEIEIKDLAELVVEALD